MIYLRPRRRPVSSPRTFAYCARALAVALLSYLAAEAAAAKPRKAAVAYKEKPAAEAPAAASAGAAAPAAAEPLSASPAPAAAPNPDPKPKAEPKKISLRDFLANQLGAKFHPRKEWAGTGDQYRPITRKGKVWEPLGRAEFVTIHHAAGVPREHPAKMIRAIYVGHTAAGGRLDAADVGYHFFVDSKGEVWEGRDSTKLGTHVGSKPSGRNNAGNLGIAGLGTYGQSAPPKAMTQGIVRLGSLIADYYDRDFTVRGHRDWVGIHQFRPRGGENCPGQLEVAVDRLRDALKTKTAARAAKKAAEETRAVASTAPAAEPAGPPAGAAPALPDAAAVQAAR